MSHALVSVRGLAGLALLGLVLAGFTPEPVGVGRPVADFRLRGVNNQVVSLADYPAAKGFIVVFTCNHCPFAQLYTARLNALNQIGLTQTLGLAVLICVAYTHPRTLV